jgi:Icc-related predicted phosphoesterase
MKIYAVADIHGAQYRVNEIREIIEENKPDIVCICGDITQFGPADIATLLLDQIPGKILAILGNIDPVDVLQGVNKNHVENIQHRRYVYKGVSFLGVSGVSDEETFSFFSNQATASFLKNIDVLLTHVPPYGFQDMVFFGRHAGSKIIYEIIQDIKPRLVLCGHIHEDPGFSNADKTVVVNCSMGKRGKGAIINLDENIIVEMKN